MQIYQKNTNVTTVDESEPSHKLQRCEALHTQDSGTAVCQLLSLTIKSSSEIQQHTG